MEPIAEENSPKSFERSFSFVSFLLSFLIAVFKCYNNSLYFIFLFIGEGRLETLNTVDLCVCHPFSLA
jgi:hypothetical protein